MDDENRVKVESDGEAGEAWFGVAELAGEFIPESFSLAALALVIAFLIFGFLAVLIHGIVQGFFDGPPQSLFR